MKYGLMSKLLRIVLVASLLIGQLPVGVTVAMPASQMDHMAMMSGISDKDVTASISDMDHDQGCCHHSDKGSDMKGGVCGACCVAAGQIATLPPQFAAPVQYAVNQTYGVTNTFSVSKNIPPDPPRPKA